MKREPWVETSPAEPTAAVAVRSLRQRLGAVNELLPLAAGPAGAGAGPVHQLRVWSRRAGAALAVYRDWLPRRRRAWLVRQLRRLRRATGAARDCDVLGQRLQGHPAAGARAWRHDLMGERARAHAALVAAARRLLRRARFARRIRGLLARVRWRGPGPEPAAALFGPWARARLRPILDKFLAALPADARDAPALHRFRLRGKRLRYAVELLAGALPPPWRDALYPTLEEMQNRLGAINDHVTALARLDRKITRARRHEARPLRDLRRHERRDLGALVAAYQAWLTPDRLRGLREARAALAVAAPVPEALRE